MKADTDQSVAKDKQAAIARGDSAREVPVTRGLSAQLLVLTIAFVMLAEVLIYVPSVSRDRLVYLEGRVVAADLATLALEEAPNNNVNDALARELLELAGVRAIVLRGSLTRRLVVADRTRKYWPRHSIFATSQESRAFATASAPWCARKTA